MHTFFLFDDVVEDAVEKGDIGRDVVLSTWRHTHKTRTMLKMSVNFIFLKTWSKVALFQTHIFYNEFLQ